MAWTGVVIDAPLDMLDFYLVDLEGFCRVLAPPSIAKRGLAEPVHGWGSMGIATADALGYLTKRDSAVKPGLFELGVCAYGPAAPDAVAALAAQVRRWREAKESVTGIRIEVYPSGLGLPDVSEAIMSVHKRHSRVVVWPETTTNS
ncbi:hypothetical protein [Stackebrandtia nassauensis]|uniref:hypothetical protein n=1 Tax=Stackebrandtia nassauensis TaxID=283811 RepID=UPI0003010449|nr:hypothetical protein [Stackebrandtia nassauensis]